MIRYRLNRLIVMLILISCGNPYLISQNRISFSPEAPSNAGRFLPLEMPSNPLNEYNSVISLVRFVAGYSDNIIPFDPIVIYYDKNATLRFDDQLDASKLYNSDAAVTNFYLFDLDGIRLPIKTLPFTGEFPCSLRLGLKTERAGDVIIRISEITEIFLDKVIELTDLVTGITINLTPDKEYKIYLPAGDYQNRFFLNLSGNLTDISDVH
jgi:hypothetical protein